MVFACVAAPQEVEFQPARAEKSLAESGVMGRLSSCDLIMTLSSSLWTVSEHFIIISHCVVPRRWIKFIQGPQRKHTLVLCFFFFVKRSFLDYSYPIGYSSMQVIKSYSNNVSQYLRTQCGLCLTSLTIKSALIMKFSRSNQKAPLVHLSRLNLCT